MLIKTYLRSLARRFIVTGSLISVYLFSIPISFAVSLAELEKIRDSTLPNFDGLELVRISIPLRIFSADGKLIAEFGAKRRFYVSHAQTPKRIQNAFIAAEDPEFYALKPPLVTKITLQIVRNLFLSREKSFWRKFKEIRIAQKLEEKLSKNKILELYLNKIYLGQRSYGIAAAANVYYGKSLKDLTLAQSAMIASLPKAPSRYNPIVKPKRAIERRNLVLGSMLKHGYISQSEFEKSKNEALSASHRVFKPDVEAAYLAEMVRKNMVENFGRDAYEKGYKVTTTIDAKKQLAATKALRSGIEKFDRKTGYRGVLANKVFADYIGDKEKIEFLKRYREISTLMPSIVTELNRNEATVLTRLGVSVKLKLATIKWLKRLQPKKGSAKKKVSQALKVGDVLMLDSAKQWRLAQVPLVQAALISMNPKTGAIESLVGGYDFNISKFNRVTQAKRQMGSLVSPFIFSAAFEKNYQPSSKLSADPIVFKKTDKVWKPQNVDPPSMGKIRLSRALALSKSIISIRLAKQLGVIETHQYLTKLGLPKQFPKNLSLALGAGGLSPLQLASSYSIFANGGYKVKPYFISKIEKKGLNKTEIVFQAEPKKLIRAVSASNLAKIKTLFSTARKQGYLNRFFRKAQSRLSVIAGASTGNNDHWAVGFSGSLITTIWFGFDKPASLGKTLYGKEAARLWMDYNKSVKH